MRATPKFPDRRRQDGQTVLWFLATVAACCCVFALVYNVGQVANHKEATINAADAAALSGAMVEARMLNFQAYTNRAMIANEVTIAQLVSLDSWVQYDNNMMQWIARYTALVPYLNSVTQTIANVSQQVAYGVDQMAHVLVPAVEAENTALWSVGQYACLFAVTAANDVASQIADANATTFGNPARYDEHPQLVAGAAAFALNQFTWLKFTDYCGGDDRKNAKDVILNSRDPFSTHRGEGWLIKALNVGLEVVGLAATFGTAYTGLEKTSGTTTLQDYDHWAAQDSLDATVSTLQFCGIILPIPCGYKTRVIPFGPPIAYGRVDADSDGSVGGNLCNQNTTNCQMAIDNAVNPISWGGIPKFRDIAQDLSKNDPCSVKNGSDSPSLSYIAAVQKSGKATLTTQRIGIGTVDVSGPQGSPGSSRSNDQLQNGDNLTAISAACTFFLRPDLNKDDKTQGLLARQDGVHEYASLYNPYWQARLTKPDTTWTTLVYGFIGHPGLNLVLNPPIP